MTTESAERKMKPVIILPVDEISKEDIALLRENGLCVVEAKDPTKVRFMEPPPNGYTDAELAAIGKPEYARTIAESYAKLSINSVPMKRPEPVATVHGNERRKGART